MTACSWNDWFNFLSLLVPLFSFFFFSLSFPLPSLLFSFFFWGGGGGGSPLSPPPCLRPWEQYIIMQHDTVFVFSLQRTAKKRRFSEQQQYRLGVTWFSKLRFILQVLFSHTFFGCFFQTCSILYGLEWQSGVQQ